jgi:hypothetical protein
VRITTNVAIHRAWLSLELSDPSMAIEQASMVQHNMLPRELSERRTSHLITVAWAHYLKRQDREALAALTEAKAAAPEQLLFTRKVHVMLAGMRKRERRSIKSDLRAMADFVGAVA